MPRTSNPQKKLHVKKGDTVVLLKDITSARDTEGNDRSSSKGTKARVLRVIPKTDRVLVEGVNIRVRHTKPNKAHPEGGRIERETPIHISNVLPADANGNPTRVGRKFVDDARGGRWVRFAKTTGEELA